MKRFIGLLLIASGLCLMWPTAVFADVNNFTITKFDADYTLTQADRQGTLIVSEHLSVDFTDFNHGILRALPQSYEGQSIQLRITSVRRDGTTEPYTSYASNGNTVLRIGSPDRTITGAHTYDISYEAANVIRFSAQHDSFTWNTNGTAWSQPFLAETARLHLPTQLADQFTQPACYTGTYRSAEHDCTVSDNGSEIVYTTTRPLQAGETMTFAGTFPVGTFHKPTAQDWWTDHAVKLTAIVVPSVFAFAVAFRKWIREGKDLRGRGTIVPEYAPPEGVSPALADGILRYQLTNKGVSATIIDLAIRKHLRIVESEDGGLLGIGKHKVYTFEKLETATGPLAPHETLILSGLFAGRSTVGSAQLKNSFYATVDLAKDEINRQLQTGNFIPRTLAATATSFLGWLIAFGVGLAIFVKLFPFASVGFGIGIVIFILFTIIMSKRSQRGVDTLDTLNGLKLYMQTAEKDRLAMLQSVDRPYAPVRPEPIRTVELFETLLPYAIVLGVEKSWATQFENIYTSPPDWYGGNWSTFNTGVFVGSLGDSLNAMNASFAAPGSSAAGGGGGFSGGGGGGGGGGGW